MVAEFHVTDFRKEEIVAGLGLAAEGDWLKAPAEPVVISYKKWGQIIDMNGTLFQPERQASFKSISCGMIAFSNATIVWENCNVKVRGQHGAAARRRGHRL